MSKLVATYPILFEAHRYAIGDELPCNNPEMVKTWIDNNVAKWEDEEEENLQTFGENEKNVFEESAEIDEDHSENEEIKEEDSEAEKDTKEENKNTKEKSKPGRNQFGRKSK